MPLQIEVNYLRGLHTELKWLLLINTYAVSLSELHLGNVEQQNDAKHGNTSNHKCRKISFAYFCFSHLQKNGKVREMITTTHNFSVSFVDQRASPV